MNKSKSFSQTKPSIIDKVAVNVKNMNEENTSVETLVTEEVNDTSLTVTSIEPTVSVEEVVQEVTTVVETVKPVVTPVVEQPVLKVGKIDMTSRVETTLVSYLEVLSANPPRPAQEFANWSFSVLSLLKDILANKDQESFNTEWNALLTFVGKHVNTFFNENYVFRHAGNWPGTDNEFVTYRKLMYFIINTVPAEKRKAGLAKIKLEQLLSGLPENMKNRLIAFYS